MQPIPGIEGILFFDSPAVPKVEPGYFIGADGFRVILREAAPILLTL